MEDDAQGKLIITDRQINLRTSMIFSLLGDGYPNRILEAAYNMSAEDFRGLFRIGDEERVGGGGAAGTRGEEHEEIVTPPPFEPDLAEEEVGIGDLPTINGGTALEDSDSDDSLNNN